jgi:hypothetical protein
MRGKTLRKSLSFFLLLYTQFAILECSKSVDVQHPVPVPVVFIPWSPDTCRSERGIDALPEKDAIQIEWIPSEESTVQAYGIYRSTDVVRPFSMIDLVRIPDSVYVDESVSVGVRYFYFIRAVTREGMWSDPSDTLNYKLLEKASGLMPNGVSEAKPVFSWEDPNREAFYILRVLDDPSDSLIWISRFSSQYSGHREQIDFNADGSARVDYFQSGMRIRWRVDVESAQENCGSESRWVVFEVP